MWVVQQSYTGIDVSSFPFQTLIHCLNTVKYAYYKIEQLKYATQHRWLHSQCSTTIAIYPRTLSITLIWSSVPIKSQWAALLTLPVLAVTLLSMARTLHTLNSSLNGAIHFCIWSASQMWLQDSLGSTAQVRNSFILRLENTQLCECATWYLPFRHLWTPGLCHVLATVNHASMSVDGMQAQRTMSLWHQWWCQNSNPSKWT